MPASWHQLAPGAAAAALDTDLAAGLDESDARRRFDRDGPNEIPAPPPPSALEFFLSQFKSLIIWVLIGAAVISGLLHEWLDAVAIMAIVLLNALLGFAQEFKAERSLAALKQLSISTARIVRAGITRSLPARELVQGDLVLLEAGDHVPADARLVYSTGLRTREATLTGESTPVEKSADALPGEAESLADRCNMVFLGTEVVAGKARALVVSTGLDTELGRIATLVKDGGPETTPLQRQLEHLGHVLLYLSLGIASLVFALGALRGESVIDLFLTAVSLAVAAIPEGLPAIVTITLALGVKKMVACHALIRRLPSVETLGSTTVICTDKTGTLTKNQMTVTRLFMDGCTFAVTGEGYAPDGTVTGGDGTVDAGNQAGVRALLEAAVLCNGACLTREAGTWAVIGDPTEGALLVAAAKIGVRRDVLETEHPFLAEIPFDPERKMMTVVRRRADEVTAYVKGAPEMLLPRCTAYLTGEGRTEPLTDAVCKTIREANGLFARDALRVLAVAKRPLPKDPPPAPAHDLERNLVFLGLAAMKDPLRPEAVAAVRTCESAGIRTVMITGDHKETAMAIARELGILNGHHALSGAELDRLTDAELAERVRQIAVYARVSAEHKLRIVKAWKTHGAIVAMTGDGVNDAPAIKAADIGVAMGLTGTDVTKEAADMVVMDDNFASIAAAVETGRDIYGNIRKAVHYLLSCNLSEVLLMLLAGLLGMPLPLLPVQILWINLVTDGFPALALTVEPPEPDSMRRPPRHPQARFLERDQIIVMFGQGLLMALITVGTFMYCLADTGQNLQEARTVTFTVVVMSQLFYAWACRSDRYSLFTIGPWTNISLFWAVALSATLQFGILLSPWTREVFNAAPLPPQHWVLVVLLSLVPLAAMEVWKIVFHARRGRGIRRPA